MDHSTRFSKIALQDTQHCRKLFQNFPVFENYIHFAFDYLEPEIWVNSPENPTVSYFYTPPAYLLNGVPEPDDADPIFASMPENSWILVSDEAWKPHLERFFGEKLETHPRTLFNASSLQLDHVRSLKAALPADLKLVRIGADQVRQTESLFHRDVLRRFFGKADFLQDGFGFCVMDGEALAGFAASNYPIRENVLEVYVRVMDEPRYRQKGLGMTLCATLIEYCLEHKIEPVWDAANDVSAHMAKKLGYTVEKEWEMYHLR